MHFSFEKRAYAVPKLCLSCAQTVPNLCTSCAKILSHSENRVQPIELHSERKVRTAIIPGGTPHMKGVGMLVGNFELNP